MKVSKFIVIKYKMCWTISWTYETDTHHEWCLNALIFHVQNSKTQNYYIIYLF